MARSTQPGSPAVTHQGAFDQTAVKDLRDSFCQGDYQNLTGTTDALAFPGNVMVSGAAIDAMTLATPLAGHQPAGDDGKEIFVVDAGGYAHTITTASNAIVNSKQVLTFNGTIGSNVTLRAMNGVWVIVGTALGVTAS